ncbi:MAG TPA: hypothetical protein VGF30_00080 [Bacteroidia bacterium]
MEQTPEKKEKKELTEDKVMLYSMLTNIFTRFILAISCIVAFFIAFYFLIKADKEADYWKFGVIDTFFAGTVFLVFKFYFKGKLKK